MHLHVHRCCLWCENPGPAKQSPVTVTHRSSQTQVPTALYVPPPVRSATSAAAFLRAVKSLEESSIHKCRFICSVSIVTKPVRGGSSASSSGEAMSHAMVMGVALWAPWDDKGSYWGSIDVEGGAGGGHWLSDRSMNWCIKDWVVTQKDVWLIRMMISASMSSLYTTFQLRLIRCIRALSWRETGVYESSCHLRRIELVKPFILVPYSRVKWYASLVVEIEGEIINHDPRFTRYDAE